MRLIISATLLSLLFLTGCGKKQSGSATEPGPPPSQSLAKEDEAAKAKRATAQAGQLGLSAQSYYAQLGSWPKTLAELGPFLDDPKTDLLDPWGKEFQFRVVREDRDGGPVELPYVWTERVIGKETKIYGKKPPDAQESPVDKATKSELDKLEGVWQVVATEHMGKKFTAAKGSETLVIGGGKILQRNRLSATNVSEKVFLDSFTIDPTKKVKELDGVEKRFNQKPRYIYELDGDSLKLATFIPTSLANPQSPSIPPGRPESFDSSKNENTYVTFLRRVKK